MYFVIFAFRSFAKVVGRYRKIVLKRIHSNVWKFKKKIKIPERSSNTPLIPNDNGYSATFINYVYKLTIQLRLAIQFRRCYFFFSIPSFLTKTKLYFVFIHPVHRYTSKDLFNDLSVFIFVECFMNKYIYCYVCKLCVSC